MVINRYAKRRRWGFVRILEHAAEVGVRPHFDAVPAFSFLASFKTLESLFCVENAANNNVQRRRL